MTDAAGQHLIESQNHQIYILILLKNSLALKSETTFLLFHLSSKILRCIRCPMQSKTMYQVINHGFQFPALLPFSRFVLFGIRATGQTGKCTIRWIMNPLILILFLQNDAFGVPWNHETYKLHYQGLYGVLMISVASFAECTGYHIRPVSSQSRNVGKENIKIAKPQSSTAVTHQRYRQDFHLYIDYYWF